jgi:hypothetical protein
MGFKLDRRSAISFRRHLVTVESLLAQMAVKRRRGILNCEMAKM